MLNGPDDVSEGDREESAAVFPDSFLQRRAVDTAKAADLPESAAIWTAEAAMRESILGNPEEAKHHHSESLLARRAPTGHGSAQVRRSRSAA